MEADAAGTRPQEHPAQAAGSARRLSWRRRWLFLAVIWLGCELLAGCGLWLLGAQEPLGPPFGSLSERHRKILQRFLEGGSSYAMHSPALGWLPAPGSSFRLGQVNSEGLRGARDYSPQPGSGEFRLLAFGDSFTWSHGVKDAQTWPALLEQTHPRLEVLNYGVTGWGPDQAFLRYQHEARGRQARVVLIGVLSENIARVVNRFRPFYLPSAALPFAKPRFELRGGELRLLPNPLPELDDLRRLLDSPQTVLPVLGRGDFFYQQASPWGAAPLPSLRVLSGLWHRVLEPPIYDMQLGRSLYHTDSEAFAILCALLESFAAMVVEDGGTPVVMMFPTLEDLVQTEMDGSTSYGPLLEHLAALGIAVFDAGGSLLEHGEGRVDPFYRPQDMHFSVLGNQVVAEALADFLARQIEGFPTP